MSALHSFLNPSCPRWLLLLMASALLLMFSSCNKGEEKPNQAPDTELWVDQINLDSASSLTTSVQLNWNGFDEDGFVAYYEFSEDRSNWVRTTTKDTLLLFQLESNTLFSKKDFYVRAIDNEGLVDGEPAYLQIPIKNSPPVVRRGDYYYPKGSTAHGVVSFSYSISDPDGDNTLDELSMKINDGDWVEISSLTNNTITLVANSIENAGPVATTIESFNSQFSASQITNRSTISTDYEGLVLDSVNTVYLRVKDFSGLTSDTLAIIDSVFFQSSGGSSRLLGSYNNTAFDRGDTNYVQYFESSALDIHYIDFQELTQTEGLGQTFFIYDFGKVIGYYDELMWSADNSIINGSAQTHIEVVRVFSEALSMNKKLFYIESFSPPFPEGEERRNAYLQLFPVDSFLAPVGACQLRIFPNGEAYSPDTLKWPTLKASRPLLQVMTFFPIDTNNIVYRGDFKEAGGSCDDTKVFMIKSENNAGETNLLYSTLPLYNLEKDSAAFHGMMDEVFKIEFNW